MKAAIKYFEKIEWVDRLISSKVSELEQLRGVLKNVSSAALSKDRVQTQPRHDKLEDGVAKLVDLEEEINRQIDCLVGLKREVNYKIDAMNNPRYETVLREKHVNLKTFEEVSECIEMSMTRTKEIYWEAIESFENKYF